MHGVSGLNGDKGASFCQGAVVRSIEWRKQMERPAITLSELSEMPTIECEHELNPLSTSKMHERRVRDVDLLVRKGSHDALHVRNVALIKLQQGELACGNPIKKIVLLPRKTPRQVGSLDNDGPARVRLTQRQFGKLRLTGSVVLVPGVEQGGKSAGVD
ncbi:MAG TPA: hypothetical protein VEQ85_00345 [Lacipirellulaceae bacterium]|nr:hypothetical protein [Lacipirellulaceae bacterium]